MTDMRGRIGIGAGAMIGLVLLASATRAADRSGKISPGKVPQKVMDTLKARFPGAEVNGAEREVEGGKVVYDLEFNVRGHKYESDIEENGTMREYEKQIPPKALPAQVSRAVRAKYRGAAIREVMGVNVVAGKTEKLDHYEVTLRHAGKTMEVTVSLDGKKIGEEGEETKE